MPPECFGCYQPEGQCLSCTLSLQCIQLAYMQDNYYDSIAQNIDSWAAEMEAAIEERMMECGFDISK